MAVPFLRLTQAEARALLGEPIGALGVQNTLADNHTAIRPNAGV